MPAQMMDGEALAAELRARVEADAAELEASGVVPGLATVLVGDDYASEAYERRVKRLAEELGCRYVSERLPADAEEAEALAIVGKLNADPRVSGILILRPLPRQVNEGHVYRTLDPLKDIEARAPGQRRPARARRSRASSRRRRRRSSGMLDRYVESTGRDPKTFYNGLDLVLVGRSNNVGKPARSGSASQRNATVISAHQLHRRRRAGSSEHTREADILVVAAGVPRLVTGEHGEAGRDRRSTSASTRCATRPDGQGEGWSATSTRSRWPRWRRRSRPYPGGVGPITDVTLLANTVLAAKLQARRYESVSCGSRWCPASAGRPGCAL